MAASRETVRNTRGVLLENVYLFALFGIGAVLLPLGFVPEYRETLIVLGVALIVSSSIGIYMMITTRNVAKGLHARFDEQNDILREIASLQKEIASSQTKALDIASSQKEIASSQSDMLKEIASSQRNIEGILKNIEDKITPSG